MNPSALPKRISRRKMLQMGLGAGLISLSRLPVLGAAQQQGMATGDLKPSPEPMTGTPVANFVDVAALAGIVARTVIGDEKSKQYILETTGGGVAVFDYDNDGWLDIFLVNGARREGFPKGEEPTNHLYRNNRDGTFTDVTVKAGLVHHGWGQGVCVGDYDGDGNLDLFVTYYGKNVLYHNNGDGTFTDVTQKSGLVTAENMYSTGAGFFDFDRDGHLDLFVSHYTTYEDATRFGLGAEAGCHYKGVPVFCGPRGLRGSTNTLYRNHGDGTFTDVSKKAGIVTDGHFGFTPLVLDYDNDGWPDVYVADDSTASLLFHNNRDGTFTEIGSLAGVSYNEDGREQGGMGTAAADYNGDGFLDIVKTNFDADTSSLYRNRGDGTFDDVTFAAGLGGNTKYVGWGVGFIDFDNDGWPDLFMVNGHVYPELESAGLVTSYLERKILYRNKRDGTFEDVSLRGGPGIQLKSLARGAAFGDLFNTGQIDIVINNMNGPPMVLRNAAPSANHTLSIKLVGHRPNSLAIGARVSVYLKEHRMVDEVRSGGSFCSQNDLRLHFGLGPATQVEKIEVRWPDGSTETVKDIPGDRQIVIRQGGGLQSAEKFLPVPRLFKT
jgi:enediyne biosynthesis protein E4